MYFLTCIFFRVWTEGEIFQKVLVLFQQARSQVKAYYYCFLFWGKILDFFFKFDENEKKKIEKPSGRGNLYPNLIFSWIWSNKKILFWGNLCPIFYKCYDFGFFFNLDENEKKNLLNFHFPMNLKQHKKFRSGGTYVPIFYKCYDLEFFGNFF